MIRRADGEEDLSIPVLALEPLARRSAPGGTLTRRESAVARLVLAGYKNKEVATALGISERTVKSHVTRIFQKCGVSGRVALVTAAARIAQRGGGA